ncbi:GHMP kinase [Thermococcus kodakarensis KOD1]|uniref:Beta-ribofuranosylaminobenzene 5'-phosphate synthase n=1 Tax=Thermococcus kodakarensis (strain ATCC BAA-918 / JCM 12380 / KOD1) TaxID=69014 RepID=Q5JHQ1_THEKO|nr:beta-ribofuranosylaminobenzene 5'-phosphate synthase family protein [Thermococcus kodakarensis]WCN28072.1 GHMP kinase [Thermococcus kodakarensis]WCN30369.1 GHMP kinase [Thermococcus kodakarensis]BAD86431.1 GHMP kinase [Thermococcus kodakarensis KOD1]
MDSIRIKAPAHLHTGNPDLSGDMGRLYGTVGFAIETPSLEVEVRKSDRDRSNDNDALKFLRRFRESYDFPPVEVTVRRYIPKWVGIGFHTTLALTMGAAISKLYGLGLSLEDVALAMRRGLITALGFYAVKVGGFIYEGGFPVDRREKVVPPLIFRGEMPEDWLFVVAIPETPRKALTEVRKREDEILGNLKKMPPELADRLSRIVLMKILPAFVERDIRTFGEGLYQFNHLLGEFWSDYQENVYCCDIVNEGIKLMLERAHCACQTSWGPTFYGLVDGIEHAERLRAEVEAFLRENGDGGEVFVTKADNRGMVVLDG